MINKNATYVVKQPTHVIMSLVILNKSYPKTKIVQDLIDELSKTTDTFFIFDNEKKVDLDKFTTLHGGIGFIQRSKKTLGETIFYVLDYAREIFNRHISFALVDENLLENKQLLNISEKLINWTSSTAINPVLNIKRNPPKELWELYKLSGLFNKKEFVGGNFITHTSNSPVIFIKNLTLDKIYKKSMLSNYLKTFTDNKMGTVLASLII